MSLFGFPGGGNSLDFPIPLDPTASRTLIVGPTLAGFGYSTIQAAVSDAHRGDVIFVQPGSYTENVTVTVDYLTIVGAQVAGYGRPDVVPASGVALTVSAQGFAAKRMRFASVGATDCVRQHGNGFRYDDCVFDGDGTSKGLRLLPKTIGGSATHYTASEGTVAGCLFRGCATGVVFDSAAGAPEPGVGSTDNLVTGCRFYANTLDIGTEDHGGTYSLQVTDIVDCVFADKNKATYIDFTTTNGGAASDQTGTVATCGFASDTMTTTKIKAVGTGFTFMGNYDTVGVFDGSGLD